MENLHFKFQIFFLLKTIKCMSQPHFEASVRMKLTLPKMGTWSPLGLPKA
jgi:hypothetical protein